MDKDRPFVWTAECQQAFDELKKKLLTAPMLSLPRLNAPLRRLDLSFRIYTRPT